jgi:Xaa-Pro aminopeptidase
VSELTRRGFLGVAGAVSFGAASLGQDPASRPASVPGKLRTGGLPPIPADAPAERTDRLRFAMKAHGLDAVFLGPTLNLQYFTGVRWGVSERLFGCVIQQRKLGIDWVSPKFEEARARESIPGLERGASALFTWEEWEDPHELIVAKSLAANLPVGRIGVDPHLRATHALRLRDAGAEVAGKPNVHFEMIDGLAVVAEVRSRKTEPELARIRRACEITQDAIALARARALVPGATEAQAAAAVNEAQSSMGLRNPWALVLFGPNAAFPHGTRERRPLVSGQMALLDCGGDLEGYQSDITRTYFIGEKPTDRQRTVYRLVRNAQKAALAAAKPGVLCEDVDRAARKVIVDGGFGPNAKYFTHRLGHGIGLEGHEDPYFCEGNTTPLATGMTLSNEPGIYIPGELGVRLEDIVVITPTGAETLGTPPADDL